MLSEERKERNRQQIIRVSTSLFIKQGIETTTLAQIAKESGVVCRTVSNIFGSKSSLVLEDLRYILQKIMERLDRMIVTPEYQALSGLEQIMRTLRLRGELVEDRPEILLLISEIKVWIARGCHDERVLQVYMENLDGIYRITSDALTKGLQDGSVNPRIQQKQALSMLVSSFRAVIQQLAQVKMNPSFDKMVDASEQLKMQLELIQMGLSYHENSAKRTQQEDAQHEF